MTPGAAILLAAVTVGTWNGSWFPSGRAEHRGTPEAEARTVAAAGRMLRAGLDKADPSGTNDVILCLNEIRGAKEADALLAAIGRPGLRLAVISGYRRRDRFDQQQDAIATTLPVAAASWSRWKTARDATPPRGYARAEIVLSPASTAVVYAVHLKSNYGQTTEAQAVTNRLKRTLSADQIVEQERPRRGRPPRPTVVAGDLNADKWSAEFREETIFRTLEEAGFVDAVELLPPEDRFTRPGKGRWRGSALDHVMLRGLEPEGLPVILPAEGLSDHYPVFVNLKSAF